jgi:signal transduction histidine kinase
MDTAGSTGKPPERSLPEALTRTLRHEVGDLLQTLYATVAILQKRLPADWSLERRVLTDLRGRAEACKQLLDAVHDFVCPGRLAGDAVDLAAVAARAAAAAAGRYPQLEVKAESSGPCTVVGDEHRLALVGDVVLSTACQAAVKQVRSWVGSRPAGGEIEWTVTDDGPEVPPDEFDRIFTPFVSTRHGRPGIGLALAHKVVTLHGGQVRAENRPGGGLCVRLVLPPAPPVPGAGN